MSYSQLPDMPDPSISLKDMSNRDLLIKLNSEVDNLSEKRDEESLEKCVNITTELWRRATSFGEIFNRPKVDKESIKDLTIAFVSCGLSNVISDKHAPIVRDISDKQITKVKDYTQKILDQAGIQSREMPLLDRFKKYDQ